MKKTHLNLLKHLELDKWPEKDRDSFLESAGDAIGQAVLLRVINLLPDNKREEFEGLLGKEEFPAIENFLALNVPEMEEIIQEEAKNYNDEAANLLKEVGL